MTDCNLVKYVLLPDLEFKIEKYEIENLELNELYSLAMIIANKMRKVKQLIKEKRNDKQCEEAA